MVSTSEFRNGLVMLLEGDLYSIVEFQHVKPGKGGAFVRTRIKNVKTGRVLDKTFRSGDKVEDVRLETRTFQFLYKSDRDYTFMDSVTYDQVTLTEDVVGDGHIYMKENLEVEIVYHGDTPIGVNIPNFVDLKIVKTDPGLKGDTVSGATKPATVESGAVVQVPLFLSEGTVIKVDTRTGIYVERVK
ncbi:MAG: elongation factor P [bacterium]|nr:elongation factor P [bacterium]